MALRARDLRKSFPTGFTLEVEELTLRPGGFYGFVGPNGAGKTVLFEALSLLAPPDEGEVELQGERIFPQAGGWRRTRREMALVMQSPYLFRGTVQQNVAYGLRARGVRGEELTRRVQTALARLGLGAIAGTDIRHLSGGEVQRAAIARALVLVPEVLFLDEPTAHVDAEHACTIEKLLQELRRETRMTVLLSTHDLEQAYRLSDEIFVLVAGRLQPHAAENCFVGTVTVADGRCWFECRPGLRFQVLAERSGPARVFVDPCSILISRQPLRSSGPNRLTGTVRAVEGEGTTMRMRVATDGAELTACLSRKSALELGVMPGERVHLTFKVAGVRVYAL